MVLLKYLRKGFKYCDYYLVVSKNKWFAFHSTKKQGENKMGNQEQILDVNEKELLGELPIVELSESFKGESNVQGNVVNLGRYTLSISEVHEYLENKFEPVYKTNAKVNLFNGKVSVEDIAYDLHNDKANMIDGANREKNYRSSIEKKLQKELCNNHDIYVDEKKLGELVRQALEPYRERARNLSEILTQVKF